ncbi:MAG: sugar ABC transporter permease [Fimbriimonadaceae bacterium]|nr:sugar ABC transporter permease [Fimbriimonadaceae bacterium]
MARRRREFWTAICCLAPSAVVITAFHLWPLLYAAWVSLHDWGIKQGPLVGLANYREALGSAKWWQSLGVTGWYVLGTVPATLLLAYLIAELLNRPLRGRSFYRVLFFTPYIVSPVAAAAVWRGLFSRVSLPVNHWLVAHGWQINESGIWLIEPRGLFQWIAEAHGASVPSWAHGPSLALCCIMVVAIWTNLGFATVVLLGGLSQIPTEVLEAARLDGATGWRLRRQIIWPLLSPVLFFLLIVFVIRAFQAFSQIYVLTGQNDLLGTTSTATYYIWQEAFQSGGKGPGFGSAVAYLLFVMVLALTWLQFAVLGRRVHYGSGE